MGLLKKVEDKFLIYGVKRHSAHNAVPVRLLVQLDIDTISAHSNTYYMGIF